MVETVLHFHREDDRLYEDWTRTGGSDGRRRLITHSSRIKVPSKKVDTKRGVRNQDGPDSDKSRKLLTRVLLEDLVRPKRWSVGFIQERHKKHTQRIDEIS